MTEVYEGDLNIFAEIGVPEPETHLLKAKLVVEIMRLVRERKLTQSAAGALMGISQPEVSRMFKGHFREYSVERLMTLLTAFDRDVEILVRSRDEESEGERGRITVRHEAA
ncbi:MAG: helix-turn-helix domain-containing protein [Mesorhizobium sp.]|nr:helix-turn-helix transcriptional regulator [Mesorhizobium sp.]MCO5162203.1 helix-turn-helix domain-containing protein [Mesorhizobium sp.]